MNALNFPKKYPLPKRPDPSVENHITTVENHITPAAQVENQ